MKNYMQCYKGKQTIPLGFPTPHNAAHPLSVRSAAVYLLIFLPVQIKAYACTPATAVCGHRSSFLFFINIEIQQLGIMSNPGMNNLRCLLALLLRAFSILAFSAEETYIHARLGRCIHIYIRQTDASLLVMKREEDRLS